MTACVLCAFVLVYCKIIVGRQSKYIFQFFPHENVRDSESNRQESCNLGNTRLVLLMRLWEAETSHYHYDSMLLIVKLHVY